MKTIRREEIKGRTSTALPMFSWGSRDRPAA
jgi:hypothetical protein